MTAICHNCGETGPYPPNVTSQDNHVNIGIVKEEEGVAILLVENFVLLSVADIAKTER